MPIDPRDVWPGLRPALRRQIARDLGAILQEVSHGSELVKSHHLDRRAVVYVRQSTPHQVLSNQESLPTMAAIWWPLWPQTCLRRSTSRT